MGNKKKKAIRYNTVINVDSVDNSHSQMIRMITSGSKVLDVGCASGVLGEYLARELQCDVVGLDYDAQNIEIARSRNCYSDLFEVDLNALAPDFLAGFEFDYIVFGDVLEHLLSPDTLLGTLKASLNSNGKFIVSLPNISHGSIKLNLLKNRFDYTPEGLLDRTHLRFYTLKSIQQLCGNCGLNIDKFNRVFAPIYGMEQKVDVGAYSAATLELVESDTESWVYQYVFSASSGASESSQAQNFAVFEPSDDELDRVEQFRRSKYKSKKSKKWWKIL